MKNLDSLHNPYQALHYLAHQKRLAFKKSGIVLINKPSGLTSHDVVQKVRAILGTKRVGHSGTLDPLSSGLMVLLINQGTKLSPYLLNAHKTYKASVTLGIRTDTWDSDGQVIDKQDVDHLSYEKIKQAIEKLTTTLTLKVPSYSAVKFKGKKLYEYARKNAKDKNTKIPDISRPMSFDQLKITEICLPCFTASLRASKGSFVRSWANAIGEDLGVGGVVSALERTASDPYKLDQAVNLETLNTWSEEHRPGFIPLENALPHWPKYIVRDRWEKYMMHGRVPDGMKWEIKQLLDKQPEQDTLGVKIYSAHTGYLIVLLKYESIKDKLKVACVFNE